MAAGALAWWLQLRPALSLQEPGADRPGYSLIDTPAPGSGPKPIGRDFRPGRPLAPADAALPGIWPGFRGPELNSALSGGPELSDLSNWQDSRVLWTATMGEGHAGAAVADGRVYVLDYDEEDRAEALRCLSLADGGELWRRSWPLRMKRNHGYSRTVPAISGEKVLTIGPLGQVMCLDRLDGGLAWTLDPAHRWQGTIPLWYAGQCPFTDRGALVLAVGGEVLAVGIDVASGEVLWTCPNPDKATTTHASVTPMDLSGIRFYLACFSTGLYGISTEGRILFRVPDWTVQVEVPSPVVLPGGRVYLTAGYGAGNMLIYLSAAADGTIAWRTIYRNLPGTALSCEQQTPIVRGGRLYGIQSKDAGTMHDQLVCMEADGRMVWTSGAGRRFGLGPCLMADGKLYVLADDGWLTVVDAQAPEYREFSRNRIIAATDAWAPMALAGTRLLLRDQSTLVCVDLSKESGQ
jgi:outer membrane protein assembly factor BamB